MKHHLMIGTWTPPGVIVTVEFDDEALTLKLVKKTEIPKDEPISWMTFDVSVILYRLSRLAPTNADRDKHKRNNIYGASMKKWTGFTVNNPSDIVQHASHPIGGHRTSNSLPNAILSSARDLTTS